MFRPSVCRIVIGKDRTFCRFPRKNPHGARRNGLSSTAGPGVRISFLPAVSPVRTCKPLSPSRLLTRTLAGNYTSGHARRAVGRYLLVIDGHSVGLRHMGVVRSAMGSNPELG
jgi:hypothetical protein